MFLYISGRCVYDRKQGACKHSVSLTLLQRLACPPLATATVSSIGLGSNMYNYQKSRGSQRTATLYLCVII